MENRRPSIIATGRASIYQSMDGHITISADNITIFGSLDDLDLHDLGQQLIVRAPLNPEPTPQLSGWAACGLVAGQNNFADFPELVDLEYLEEKAKQSCSSK